MRKKPNILLIMTDEQRFDAVGYANKEVHTPYLDALAQDSVVFRHAYASNPSCIPSRAAMFTGRYPSQCGAPCYITPLNADETTFMTRLQDAGYHTGCIGKQHFWTFGGRRGYDYEDIVDYHAPMRDISPEVDPRDFGLPGNHTVTDRACSYQRFLYESGFRHGEELYEAVSEHGVYRWKADEKYHVDAFLGDRAVDWLDAGRPKDRPWFLHLSFPGPHMPFDGIGLSDAAHYDLQRISLPQTSVEDLHEKPEYYRHLADKYTHRDAQTGAVQPGLGEEEIRLMRLAYYANMSLIDRKVGQVIEKLKAFGLYDDTLILFTSDHGDYMGDYGMATKAQYLSEALLRVPLLLKPAQSGFVGRAEDGLVSNIQIPATCLEAADVPIPRNGKQGSLLAYVNGQAEGPKTLYAEGRDLRSIRDERFKLIYYAKRPYGELYDLAVDPQERHNLWSDPAFEGEKQRLIRLLLDQVISLGENMDVPWNVGAPQI